MCAGRLLRQAWAAGGAGRNRRDRGGELCWVLCRTRQAGGITTEPENGECKGTLIAPWRWCHVGVPDHQQAVQPHPQRVGVGESAIGEGEPSLPERSLDGLQRAWRARLVVGGRAGPGLVGSKGPHERRPRSLLPASLSSCWAPRGNRSTQARLALGAWQGHGPRLFDAGRWGRYRPVFAKGRQSL